MRNTAIVWFLLLLCFLWDAEISAQNKTNAHHLNDTITAVVLRDLRPNSFINPKYNKISGFSIDVSNAVAFKLKYHVKYIIVNDWKEADSVLKNGYADFCPEMAISETRLKEYLFTESVETFNISICIRAHHKGIKDTSDLKGKMVGVIHESQAYNIIKNIKNINVCVFESFQEAFFELLAGRIDAFVGPETTIRNFAYESQLSNSFKILPQPLKEIKRYFAFNKTKSALFNRYKPAISQFTLSQQYRNIYLHWNAPPYSYWSVKNVLILTGICFILTILILLFLHNRSILKINNQLSISNNKLKVAKQFVEESEKKYRQAVIDLNNAQYYSKIGSWKWYIQENKLDLSDEMYRIFDIEPAEYTFTALIELLKQRIHPEDIIKFINIITEINDKNVPAPLESRIILKNKKTKTIWSKTGDFITDTNGNPYILEGIVQDITERKKIEDDLESEKEKFVKIFDHAPVLISITDLENEIYEEVNEYALNFSGYTKEEVIGRKSTEIKWISPENRNLLKDTLLKNGKIENLELPFKTKNGNIIYGLVNGDMIFFNHKKCLLTITTDVTDKRNKEEAIRKLKSAIDSSQASIVITDFEGNIEFANPYFIEHTGYTPEEFLGKNPRLLKSDKHTTEFYKEMWDTIKSGKKWEGEFYNRKKNGEFYWENAIISPVFSESNKITNFVAVKFDITENKKITNELIEAKEKAEKSDRFKTAFLQNLSHEIRTPLNAILGFSEVIVKYYNDKSKIEYFSKIIIQRGNDLLEMIEGILDIARIESGNTTVTKMPFNLNILLLELEILFNDYKTRYNKDNIELIIKKEKTIIVSDSGKIKQILVNLINNAFKFTDAGKIEVGYRFENNQIIFHVADTGIGIPKDKQDFIFERFAQLKNDKTRLTSGTGLGLSIVKGLVELMGGKIWVNSEPDKGATFFVSIPVQMGQQEINEPGNLNSKQLFKQIDGDILIVEDDDFNCELLTEILAETNFHITQTKYGREAIELSQNTDFRIILMDIGLPDITGYEAIHQILAKKPNLKIIAQTAFASYTDKEKALNAGCIDYISKPIKKEQLLQKIKNTLFPENLI